MEYEKIHRKTEYILTKLKYLKNNRPEDVEQFKSDDSYDGILRDIGYVTDKLVSEL